MITTKAADDDLEYKGRTENEADFEDKERAEDDTDLEDKGRTKNEADHEHKERTEDEAGHEDKEREEDETAFEHACEIKGAPFETSLIPENPELRRNIYSVAPGEGQKPIPILTDPKFEEMCNPDKYPFGKKGTATKANYTMQIFQSKKP